jgi:hypothetical protein
MTNQTTDYEMIPESRAARHLKAVPIGDKPIVGRDFSPCVRHTRNMPRAVGTRGNISQNTVHLF